MFGWAALDVAIGLFFMYVLLSMIGTAVQEAIASLFKLRASNLRQGIENLLNDNKLTTQAKFEDLASALYDHPAIKSLYRGNRRILCVKLESRPSYIPSRTFVIALLDEIRKRNAERAGEPADKIEKIGASELFRRARTIVDAMPECDLKAQLTLLTGDIPEHAADLEKKVTDAVERLESWFNEAMDGISGWYKRKAKLVAMVVGVAMAVVLNADSLHVATALWSDSDLRTSLAEGAARYVQGASKDEIAKAEVSELRKQLSQSGLPIGWRFEKMPETDVIPISLQAGQNAWVVVVGWIITGFALSLGASFWFDMLSKVVSLRGSGAQVSTQTGKAVDKS